MKLSILIATIPGREHLFGRLMSHLWRQVDTLPVEIIYDASTKESMSIGAKRQRLLESAKGEYIVFIDDDDWVVNDYVEAILQATITNPDCIGFQVEVNGMGRRKLANASNRYERWGEKQDGFDFVRTIYHKTPVKREHALAIGFSDMRFAEDHQYSDKLKASGLLKKEAYIDRVLYIYRYRNEPIKKKFGIK
jgi:glycosyltransferase involved in cell wall biosynthesis